LKAEIEALKCARFLSIVRTHISDAEFWIDQALKSGCPQPLIYHAVQALDFASAELMRAMMEMRSMQDKLVSEVKSAASADGSPA
jgi:hypothetical protein